MLKETGNKIDRLGTTFDLAYCWQYAEAKRELRNLYEKAKKEQWNATFDLDWSIEVNPEDESTPDAILPTYGTELWDRLTEKEIRKFRREQRSWTLSQFLHGEQGALLATAQVVTAVPWLDAKLYGSTQVIDEGRHVETFHRYLSEKIEKEYPINKHLKYLLDIILTDSRWDMKYLGMQILVEGLALGAFAVLYKFSTEPLLVQILKLIMQDEARHVAFGVLTLRDHYVDLSEGERRDREDFAYEASVLMRDRFISAEVAEEMGMPLPRYYELAATSESMIEFRKFLFTKLVPNLKRLGLLTNRMRPKYESLGILQFEDYEATV